MKICVIAAVLLTASPALADYPTTTALPPCGSATSGNALIVQRPPTDAEIAAALPQKLQMMNDHISCNGSAWSLTSSVPQYGR